MDFKVKYGKEIGANLIKIVHRLAENQNICQLLINTDLDPLDKNKHPEHIDWKTLMGKQIRFIPLLTAEDQSTTSKIVIIFEEGSISSLNPDNESLSLVINVYCPFKEWQITGNQLRPFAIMAEIRETLQDRRINGLGEIKYHGFSLSTLTEEMGSYSMRFSINAFS